MDNIFHQPFENPYVKLFPKWNELDITVREDIINCLNNANKGYAKGKLIQEYGMDCDSDHIDSNSRVCDR